MNSLTSACDDSPDVLWRKVKLTSVAINSNYNDYNLYCRRAALYEKLGMFRLSLDDSNKAIGLNASKYEAYLSQAHAYVGLKMYSEAEQTLLNVRDPSASCDLLRQQLCRLRFLAVKQIGFDDQTSELASRKFNTVSDAIEGALNMDLETPASMNVPQAHGTNQTSTTVSVYNSQSAFGQLLDAQKSLPTSFPLDNGPGSNHQNSSSLNNHYMHSMSMNQNHISNSSSSSQSPSLIPISMASSYHPIPNTQSCESIAPSPLHPIPGSLPATISGSMIPCSNSAQTMISNNIVTNIIKIATPKKKQKRKNLFGDLLNESTVPSSLAMDPIQASPAKIAVRSSDNMDHTVITYNNKNVIANSVSPSSSSLTHMQMPNSMQPLSNQSMATGGHGSLEGSFEQPLEEHHSVQSYTPDGFYTSEDHHHHHSHHSDHGDKLANQAEHRLHDAVDSSRMNTQLHAAISNHPNAAFNAMQNINGGHFDSTTSDQATAIMAEHSSSEMSPPGSASGHKLPAYTPVKDLFRDIENEFFCSDFNTSPFSRSSNSAYSLVDSLSTPHIGEKARDSQSRCASAKPEVVKDLINDLSETGEPSSIISFSPLSSPVKTIVGAQSSPGMLSSPRILSVQSPRVNSVPPLPIKCNTNRASHSGVSKSNSAIVGQAVQSMPLLNSQTFTSVINSNHSQINTNSMQQQENEQPHRVQNPGKNMERKTSKGYKCVAIRPITITSIQNSVNSNDQQVRTSTPESTTIRNPAVCSTSRITINRLSTSMCTGPTLVTQSSNPSMTTAVSLSLAHQLPKPVNPYLSLSNTINVPVAIKKEKKRSKSKVRIQQKVFKDCKAIKKKINDLGTTEKVVDGSVGFNPVLLAMPIIRTTSTTKPIAPKVPTSSS